MSYHFSKTVTGSWDEAREQVTEALKKEGFGILTEINMQATLKNKLGVDLRPYVILGACNPNFAYEALKAEPYIGTMLPCNVIMQETALRELHEEVGIPKNEVTVIGELTDIYIPVSNYHVFPFIGFISSEHPRWVIQESEVEDVLEVPLSTLQDPNTFCLSSIDNQ